MVIAGSMDFMTMHKVDNEYESDDNFKVFNF